MSIGWYAWGYVFSMALLLFASNGKAQEIHGDPNDPNLHISDTTVATLHNYLQQINRWKRQGNYDSAYAVNDSMIVYLSAIDKNPRFLKQDYSPLVQEGMRVNWSADSLCLSLNWELAAYGNMHYWNTVFSHEDVQGTNSNINIEGGSMMVLATLHDKGGKTIYLLRQKNDYMPDRKCVLLAKTLELIYGEQRFADVPLFRSGKDTTSMLTVNYSVDPNFNEVLHVPDIDLSKDRKQLYVPIVGIGGAFSGEYKVYQWNGVQFIYRKTAKRK